MLVFELEPDTSIGWIKQNERCKWGVCSGLNRETQGEWSYNLALDGVHMQDSRAKLQLADKGRRYSWAESHWYHLPIWNIWHLIWPLISISPGKINNKRWTPLASFFWIMFIKTKVLPNKLFRKGRKLELGLDIIFSHSFYSTSF